MRVIIWPWRSIVTYGCVIHLPEGRHVLSAVVHNPEGMSSVQCCSQREKSVVTVAVYSHTTGKYKIIPDDQNDIYYLC